MSKHVIMIDFLRVVFELGIFERHAPQSVVSNWDHMFHALTGIGVNRD